MAADSAPFLEGDFYRTWFYFSVTGVPQGEQLTFTFKNLNNQVSLHFYRAGANSKSAANLLARANFTVKA